MGESNTIGVFYGVSIIIIFAILLFLLIRQIFVKGIIHFKLLKELYPKELKKEDFPKLS